MGGARWAVAGARKLACRATSQRPVGGIAPKERTGPKGAGPPAREEIEVALPAQIAGFIRNFAV